MDKLNKSSREIYDKLSKSSQDTYDRAISFLTSDYAKLLGKNALISILSLIIIGGAAVASARGVEKLQLTLDENQIKKSQLSRIIDLILTAKNSTEPTGSDKRRGVKIARAMILDILSKLGGKYSKGGALGNGFTQSDIKKKFKEVSKKVYDSITSDEAKSLGKNALVTIILLTMGYGASKLASKWNQKGELQQSAKDIEHDIKMRDFNLKSKELKDINDAAFAEKIKKITNKKTKYPIEYGAESDPEEEEEYYEVQTTNPAIVNPTVARGLKGGNLTAQNIKEYLHRIATSKEAKVLGATALAALIMAGLGIAAYKANAIATDDDFIKSQRNVARLKAVLKVAKEKHTMPIKNASAVVDILEEELEAQMRQATKPDTFEEEDEEELQHKLNIPLSTLSSNKTISELEEMYKKIESDTMTKQIAEKAATGLVDNFIKTEIKNVTVGNGLKGGGFNDDVKKAKDKIYKIITNPKAKAMGIAALSTLILTALGGLGYNMIKTHEDKFHDIEKDAASISRTNKFIKELESAWEPEYKEGERATHFVGMGLKEDTQKGLERASKKIADLIQYARDLNLDKAALFSLITFLLGGVGYGGFKYISGKARESEPIGYIPEDEVRQALEDFATGKHRLTERIKADTKDANLPWGGLGLNKKIIGGANPFGEYAKKKEEAEKNAKPIAKKITDWIYSDEAKLIGKAGLQYTILAALGLLTAYAGKKAGEAAISAIPKDRTKVNDPEAIMKGLKHAPTGDIEEVEKLQRQKATDERIRSAFKESSPKSDEILNLKRFALENPKNKAVQLYLKEKGYDQPLSEDIMRMDPRLATLFNLKADKPTKQQVHKYYPDTFSKFKDLYNLGKEFQTAKYLREAESGNQTLGDAKKKEEESKEDFKHLKEFVDKNLPKEAGSDIDVAIKALEEVEQNRPNLTPSIRTGAVSKVKDIAKRFSGGPQGSLVFSKPKVAEAKVELPTDGPKKERKPRHSLARILAEVEAHEEEGDRGDGLKENMKDFGKASAKKINEVGNAIYKIISSNEVKGVAGGVTAGLIVSILSMLMHEKRQETLAARKEAARRATRPRIPAPNRPAPPPPSRGDNEFNPFANV